MTLEGAATEKADLKSCRHFSRFHWRTNDFACQLMVNWGNVRPYTPHNNNVIRTLKGSWHGLKEWDPSFFELLATMALQSQSKLPYSTILLERQFRTCQERKIIPKL